LGGPKPHLTELSHRLLQARTSDSKKGVKGVKGAEKKRARYGRNMGDGGLLA
jgi:hypothetical protein